MTLTDSIAGIKGIGKSRLELLHDAGLNSVADLLGYLPRSYEDSTQILTIAEALEAIRKAPVWDVGRLRLAVKAKTRKINSFRTPRGFHLIKIVLEDGEYEAQAMWFNQEYALSGLVQGEEYLFYGKIRLEGRQFVFQSPQFEQLHKDLPLKKLGKIVPVYRKVKSVTTAYIKNFVQEAIKVTTVNEYIPEDVLDHVRLPSLNESFKKVHAPGLLREIPVGYRRLALQELLELRSEYEHKFKTNSKVSSNTEIAKNVAKVVAQWLPKLPFKLTAGQEQVLDQILQALSEKTQIDALLYGDVGSGKTIVALLLLFAFAMQEKSVVLLAPTTILARQHVVTARKLAATLGLESLLEIEEVSAGAKKTVTRSKTVYIGTQAILHQRTLLDSPQVGFVCIDEQHKFGVEQRLAIKSTGRPVLTLSATPIPRTLALSFLGFSQAYLLEEKPVGRLPVTTKVVPSGKEEATYQWIAEKVTGSEQAYLVFPRILQADESDLQSLVAMEEVLKEKYFSEITTGLLHGGMKETEKQKVMADFSSGKIRLLFSTTVIEVGVDVPNATIIAIHGSEMFGLAQLHQLRGRVGRSSQKAYCLLFPGELTASSLERLDFFSTHTEGIEVAEYDLKSRGTGTLLGSEQSGLSELRIASLSDLSLFRVAMEVYEELKKRHVAIRRIFRVKSDRD